MKKITNLPELTQATRIVGELRKTMKELNSFIDYNNLDCNLNQQIKVNDGGLIRNYIIPNIRMLISGNHKNFTLEDENENITLVVNHNIKIETHLDDSEDTITDMVVSVVDLGNKNSKFFGLSDPFETKHMILTDVVKDYIINNTSSMKFGYIAQSDTDKIFGV